MINIARRYRVFRSMNWRERKRYYRFRFNKIWGATWRFPIVAIMYPVAWLLGRMGVRFLTSRRGQPRIGHLAFELHIYVKAMRIGIWEGERPIFLGSSGLVANSSLRDYWATLLTVVKSPFLTVPLRPFSWLRATRRDIYPLDVEVRTEDGRVLTGYQAADHVFIEYDRRFGDAPLLELNSEHRKLGRAILEKLGVPRGAWFVALHVRESGFVFKDEPKQPRDGDIADYLDAVKLITGRGGWVIRVGNPNMTRLPEIPNVVDYAFSEHRSAEMDIFLLGDCRFFLGTDSGPADVSPLFGRPFGIVAMVPPSSAGMHRNGVYLPNTFWSMEKNRLLTFPELMESDIRDNNTAAQFRQSRIEVVPPNPGEITELAAEILARVEGTAVYDDTDARLQERWWELVFARETVLTRGALSTIGRDFLRRNEKSLFVDSIPEDM